MLKFSICLFLQLLTLIFSNNINENFQIEEGDLTDNTYVWKGFDYKWERTLIFFETDHRIGSIGSQISNEKFDTNTKTTSAYINSIYTPGVNGDWAFPSTNFSIIYSNENSNKLTKFLKTKVRFNLTDEADTNHVASTGINLHIPISNMNYQSVETILNGYKIEMECIKTDSKCNSNGIWPSKLYISIENCKNSMCELKFEINRGWTPSKGGGKAFNYNMEYRVEIDLLSIYSSEDNLYSYDDSIKEISDIHHGSLLFNRQIPTIKDISTNQVVTGITSFGFDLKKYKNFNDLGRYIGKIQFQVGNTKYSDGMITYDSMVNINSSSYTVLNSEVEYIINTKTLIIQDKIISDDLKINGNVCKTDYSTLFFCSIKGYEEKNYDSVLYNSTLVIAK